MPGNSSAENGGGISSEILLADCSLDTFGERSVELLIKSVGI